MDETDTMALAMAGVRDAWNILAPAEKWRGHQTGWNAVDLWALSGLVYEQQPAAVIIAGGLEGGGLATYIGDLLDLNKRGKVLAAQAMSREKRRTMPEHRRVQWLDDDLLDDNPALWNFTRGASPVLVIVDDADAPHTWLADAVTIGGYLISPPVTTEPPPAFAIDQARDPFGLSRRSWMMRVPV